MGKIENETQLKITKRWLSEFETKVSALRMAPLNGTHPMLRSAEIEGQESQIETFKKEIAEYE